MNIRIDGLSNQMVQPTSVAVLLKMQWMPQLSSLPRIEYTTRGRTHLYICDLRWAHWLNKGQMLNPCTEDFVKDTRIEYLKTGAYFISSSCTYTIYYYKSFLFAIYAIYHTYL